MVDQKRENDQVDERADRGYSRPSYSGSRVLRTAAEIDDGFDRAIDNSAAVRTIRHWLERSVLYHWLTTEPEKEPMALDASGSAIVASVFARLREAKRRWTDDISESLLLSASTVGWVRSVPIRMMGWVAVVLLFIDIAAGVGTAPTPGLVARGLLLLVVLVGLRMPDAIRNARAVRLVALIVDPPVNTNGEERSEE